MSKLYYFAFLLLFLITSCSSDKTSEVIGEAKPMVIVCDSLNETSQAANTNIELDSKTKQLNVRVDNYPYWIISSVEVYKIKGNDTTIVSKADSRNIANGVSFVGEWYKLQVVEKKKLTCTLQPNNTNASRGVRVFMNSGDAFASISIYQNASSK